MWGDYYVGSKIDKLNKNTMVYVLSNRYMEDLVVVRVFLFCQIPIIPPESSTSRLSCLDQVFPQIL